MDWRPAEDSYKKLHAALRRVALDSVSEDEIDDEIFNLRSAAVTTLHLMKREKPLSEEKANEEIRDLRKALIDLHARLDSLHGPTRRVLRDRGIGVLELQQRLAKYSAMMLQNDWPEDDGIPRKEITVYPNEALGTRDDLSVKRGRNKDEIAPVVREAAINTYERITGNRRSYTTNDRDEITGPFVEFLQEVYDSLGLPASAKSQMKTRRKNRARWPYLTRGMPPRTRRRER